MLGDDSPNVIGPNPGLVVFIVYRAIIEHAEKLVVRVTVSFSAGHTIR